MQPNDPNKTYSEDTDKDSTLNQPNEPVNAPGAPMLPGTEANNAAPESGTVFAPEATSDTSEAVEGSTADSSPTDLDSTAFTEKPVVSPDQPDTTPAPAPVVAAANGKKGKKKFGLLAIIIAILILCGGAAGAYFGLYLPSKPENIWKSTMTNSGKVYDEAVTFATKDREQEAMKIEGSYDLDGALESDGKVTGEWKGLDGNLNGSISAAGLKIGVDTRSIKATDDSSDLYFKLTGLQGLGSLVGGTEYEQILNGLNDQWFFVDHTLLEQAASAGGSENYSREDIEAFLKKAGVPTKEYVFSSDPQKAVFEVKQQIGTEQKDGRKTYHYKVGYNNEHFGKYVESLCNTVKDDKIGKLILEQEKKKKNCAELGADAAKQKTNETADVWVDKRTKLPHVVRVADPKDAENWIEFGQDYQGGDEFPMSLKVHGKEKEQLIEADFKAVFNIKTDESSVTGTFSSKGEADQKISGKVSLKLTPSNESEVKVEKPGNAKSIIELLNSLGLGELLGSMGGGDTRGASAEAEETPQMVQ